MIAAAPRGGLHGGQVKSASHDQDVPPGYAQYVPDRIRSPQRRKPRMSTSKPGVRGIKPTEAIPSPTCE